jgi:hypothetical protein
MLSQVNRKHSFVRNGFFLFGSQCTHYGNKQEKADHTKDDQRQQRREEHFEKASHNQFLYLSKIEDI